MTVPKITSYNFESFELVFQVANKRKVGLYLIQIYYLLHSYYTGKYDTVIKSSVNKINKCVTFVGKYYRDYVESLYTLLVQDVGTS